MFEKQVVIESGWSMNEFIYHCQSIIFLLKAKK